MQVVIRKTFSKDLDKIEDPIILKSVILCLYDCKKAVSLSEIKNVKKLKKGKFHYRIRIGSYRIGLIVNKDIMEFVRILHRKDIYQLFPK